MTVITGGLGPTKDDITKKTLAEMFRSDMRYDERVAGHVEKMLAERGIEFNELNRSQAMVPACCTVLFNAHGTAPGMWFEREGHVVVSLPGVPFEMEHLMEDEVMPRLKTRFALRQIVHRTMITAGLPESMLAKRIEAWENALPPYLKLAYLPNPARCACACRPTRWRAKASPAKSRAGSRPCAGSSPTTSSDSKPPPCRRWCTKYSPNAP